MRGNASFIPIMLGGLVISVYSLSENSLAILLSYLIFGIVGGVIAFFRGSASLRIYSIVYGWASVAAVVLAVIYTTAYGTPYWGGGSDELFFESNALEFANRFSIWEYGLIRRDIVPEWDSTVGYIYIVSLLVRFADLFGGFHTMVPRLLNAMSLSLISILIFSLGLKIRLRKETAFYAALSTGFTPLLMWTAVQSLRDIVQALLILTVVYIWIPAINRKCFHLILIRFMISAFLLIPIWEIRKGQAILTLIIILAALVLNLSLPKSGRLVNKHFIGISLVLALGALLFLIIFQSEILIYIEASKEYSEYQANGGASMESGMSQVIFEMPLFPIGWLFRITYALASPLPVSLWPLYNAWISIGTIMQILAVPYLLIGITVASRFRQTRMLIFAFIAFLSSMAFFTFTIRHSVYWVILAIPIIAIGYERYKGSHLRMLTLSFAVTASLGIFYLMLKLS